MTDVRETRLPGVGVRYDFDATSGDRIGVLALRSGRREVFLYDPDDPDRVEATIHLDPDESRTLAEALGGGRISESVAALQHIEGIAIDFVEVGQRSACAGRSIGDAGLRTRTGVSIVAIVREDGAATVPAPGPEEVLRPGDVAVAVGTTEGLARAFELLQKG